MFARFPKPFKSLSLATAAISSLGAYLYLSHNPNYKPRPQRIVIVGAGTAGVGVAAMLRNDGASNVTLIDPAPVHYYQPLWSLVGGGAKPVEMSVKKMEDVIPKGTTWVKKRVQRLECDRNMVKTEDGGEVQYDYLIVAAGIQIDWDKISGLKESLDKEGSGVVSIFDYKYADKTARTFKELQGKSHIKMIYTMSPTGIKCAGAPQKVMWYHEDTLRSMGLRDRADIAFWSPGGAMFGVPYYSQKLDQLRQERGVNAVFKHVLKAVDPETHTAVFENVETKEQVEEKFDMLHVAPYMSSPDFLKASPLADASGFVDVDPNTLQSKKYKNVFALGDCTNTPNSKTAAAITSQAPVLVHNLERAIDGLELDGKYYGYASCPIIIGRNKLLMAEFGYGGALMETFSPQTGKFPLKYIGTEGVFQQRFFFFLKETIFPYVYWNLWTRGLWYGTNGPLKPNIIKKGNATNET